MTHDLSNRTMYVRTVLWTDAATQVVVQPANKNPSTAAGTVRNGSLQNPSKSAN